MTAASSCEGIYRKVLDQKRMDLTTVLQRREGIVIEKSPDPTDEIQYAYERDIAIRNLTRDSQLLEEVKGAVRRIDDGNFGVCVRCDALIADKRLAAVPWASQCIHCQETTDRDGSDSARETHPLTEFATNE